MHLIMMARDQRLQDKAESTPEEGLRLIRAFRDIRVRAYREAVIRLTEELARARPHDVQT